MTAASVVVRVVVQDPNNLYTVNECGGQPARGPAVVMNKSVRRRRGDWIKIFVTESGEEGPRSPHYSGLNLRSQNLETDPFVTEKGQNY